VLRFGLEFLRGDNPAVGGTGGLTFSQCVMMVVVGTALVTWWVRRQWGSHWGLRTAREENTPAARGAAQIAGAHP